MQASRMPPRPSKRPSHGRHEEVAYLLGHLLAYLPTYLLTYLGTMRAATAGTRWFGISSHSTPILTL